MSTTVLVAEDYTLVRQVLVAALETIPNIRVICEVADGSHAVAKAKALQPDLILLDIGLPNLNGLEAARQIRDLSPKSKIIFVTQEISSDVVRAAFEAGASGYVVKTDAGRDLRRREAVLEAVPQQQPLLQLRMCKLLNRQFRAFHRRNCSCLVSMKLSSTPMMHLF